MNAIRIYTRGGPEGLVYEQALMPLLGAHEVLVRVHAAVGYAHRTRLDWSASKFCGIM